MKVKIIGVKGFNKDMTCKDMQYEEGKTYKMEGEPKCCDRGYHFCENPIDCLRHYSPDTSVYHKVEALGDIVRDTDDTKIATNEIKIGARIDFQTMVKMAIDFTYKHCKKGRKGTNMRTNNSVSSNTGYNSVAKNLGIKGISSNLGIKGKSSGKKGTWLVLAEWIFNDDEMEYEVKEIKTVVVDGKKIKEDTYYALEDGKFVEKGAVEND